MGAEVGVNWIAIKASWESGITSYQLAKEYPVTRQGIDKKAKTEGWTRDGDNQQPGGWLAVAEQTSIVSDDHYKATPKRLAAIFEAISGGAAEGIAAQANGIDPKTLQRWKRADPSLAEAIEVARAQDALRDIGNIRKAGDRGDWKASAYRLERNDLTKAAYAGQASGGITIVLNIPREPLEPVIEGQVIEA